VITLISQGLVPLGICFTAQGLGMLHSTTVWSAILAGHFTRCALSVARFHQGRWRQIAVDVR
jgi:Na+-driven multidrug efflux pump